MKGLLCLFGRLVVGSILMVFFFSRGLAQPANDPCAGATVITSLPYHTTENTRLATPDPGDPIMKCNEYGVGLDGKTVWFVWTADTTAWIRFSTIGSTPADTFDTVLGLFTGSCGSLTFVECNDDSVSGHIRQSVLYYYVTKGTTYTLLVAEWNGGGISGGVPTGGDLVLDVFQGVPPPEPPLVQGPKSGSVASGATVNTGSYMLQKSMGPPAPRIVPHMPPVPLLPLPKGMVERKGLKNSISIEDRSVTSVQSATSRPIVLKRFSAVGDDGYIPPDPVMATGPNHVIVAVNSQFRIFDKNGNMLKSIDAETWYKPTVPAGEAVGFSDPQVIYDHFANRWVMTGGRFSGSTYGILVSVSDDDNPMGTWYNWMLPTTLGDSVTGNFPDYPQLGFDSQALYVTTRDYGPTGSGIFYTRVRIIGKAQLYANTAGTVTWTDFWDLREPDNLQNALDHVKPARTYGNPGVEFLANASPYTSGAFFTIWKITNPLTAPSVTAINVASSTYAPAAQPNQLGGGLTIDGGGGDYLTSEPVCRDSSLWLVHTVASGTGNAYSSVHYARINPFTNTNIEDVRLGLDGYWHFYPAIMVDVNKNVLISFNRSGVSDYIGAFVTGHRSTDPPGLSPSTLIKAGEANYVKDYGGGRNRWGDYNGIALDPADTAAVWSLTEYASSPSSNWNTMVSMEKMAPLPGRFINTDPAGLTYSTREVGFQGDTAKLSVINTGIDTLVISGFSLPDPSFHIVSSPSLPLRLATFESDSFAISFLPSRIGINSGNLYITNNDSINPVDSVSLVGTGFFITHAQPGVLYAGAGSDGAGEVLTVNMISGAGTTLGPSGFSSILSARVNPSTNEIIGLGPSGGQQALVRINSAGGDAHKLVTFATPVVPKGMAFKNDTLYIGTLNGVIYKLDINTGTPTQVVSTGLLIAGLDFNPITGVLWVSVQGGSINDGIYKVNLSTGTPTLVGRTGLRKPTQDIIFDASGNLYGIAGSSSGNNSFIIIDTLAGSATVIGSVGYSSVVCLAMDPSTRFFGNTYRLKASWNLLSVPVVKQNYARAGLFPSSVSQAYGYDGQYKLYDTLENGRGYWLKFASAKTFSMVGAADTLDTINVHRRWNIVGSLSVPLPVSEITSIPSNIISSNFFSYDKDSGYMVASTIKPGLGYWVRSDSNGQLVLSPSTMIPKQSLVEQSVELLNKMNTLTIRSNDGMAQTLYFGSAGTDAQTPEMFELPPPAPAGILDVRFSTNTILAAYDSKQGKPTGVSVLVQSPSFPVTVQWHIDHDMQLKYSLLFTKEKSSQNVAQVMRGDGSVSLTSGQAANLRLQIGNNVLPTQFALAQNYPNPFNPATTIRYELPADAYVKLVVYDVLGREVVTLVDGQQQAGFFDATFSATKVASGVYFYRLHAEALDRASGMQGFQSVRKMVLLK